MTQAQNELLLIAIVPSEVKDDLVDALMEYEKLSGFSLSKIQGYSRAHSRYSLREQVEGHREFFRFELLHQPSDTAELRALLGKVSAMTSIRYWILPLVESGII